MNVDRDLCLRCGVAAVGAEIGQDFVYDEPDMVGYAGVDTRLSEKLENVVR
jgi:hypothetical protein